MNDLHADTAALRAFRKYEHAEVLDRVWSLEDTERERAWSVPLAGQERIVTQFGCGRVLGRR